MRRFLYCLVLAGLLFISCKNEEPIGNVYDRVLKIAGAQAEMMLGSLSEGEYPRSIMDGRLCTSDYVWWCSGYFPGVLWQLVDATGDDKFVEPANRLTGGLETLKTTTSQHDIGLHIICSYGRRYNLYGKDSDKSACS